MSNTDRSGYNIQNIDCPSCQSESATVVSHAMDIPYYDDFIMVSVNCPKCGYRSSDFYNMQSKGHTIFIYTVTDSSDDTTKVVRSISCSVSIPEIDVTIDPYGSGLSWIRNIEGILEDINNKLILLLRDSETENEKRDVQERIRKLRKLKSYKVPFTIVVDDPSGNSLILPADESKLKITVLNLE